VIRLLCVEDDPIVRTYLATRLSAEPDIQLVGAVSDMERALIHLRGQEIDVVLLDFYLHGMDGTHVLRAMNPWRGDGLSNEHQPAILFCTGHASEAFEAQARTLGAHGVVAKERIASDLLSAVRAVAGGGTWFAQDVHAHSSISDQTSPYIEPDR
jgi:DNA-binding NarL/FixJ family response regulator